MSAKAKNEGAAAQPAEPGSGKGTSAAAEAFFEKAAPKEPSRRSEGLDAGIKRYQGRSLGLRSPSLLILVIGVSAWLLYSMRADLEYFLLDPVPVSLGDMEGYDLARAKKNSFVRIEGLPHHLQAQYRQLGRRYRVYPLIGTRVFVREPLSDRPIADDEYPSFSGEGRLLDIREERAFANVRTFFQEKGRYNFSEPAWILLVDVGPRQLWWVPVAYLALGAILILNLGLLLRRLRSSRA